MLFPLLEWLKGIGTFPSGMDTAYDVSPRIKQGTFGLPEKHSTIFLDSTYKSLPIFLIPSLTLLVEMVELYGYLSLSFE